MALCHQYKTDYDEGKAVDLSPLSIDEVGGILRLWLRSLSDPLFTFEMYPAFISAISTIFEKNPKDLIKKKNR